MVRPRARSGVARRPQVAPTPWMAMLPLGSSMRRWTSSDKMARGARAGADRDHRADDAGAGEVDVGLVVAELAEHDAGDPARGGGEEEVHRGGGEVGGVGDGDEAEEADEEEGDADAGEGDAVAGDGGGGAVAVELAGAGGDEERADGGGKRAGQVQPARAGGVGEAEVVEPAARVRPEDDGGNEEGGEEERGGEARPEAGACGGEEHAGGLGFGAAEEGAPAEAEEAGVAAGDGVADGPEGEEGDAEVAEVAHNRAGGVLGARHPRAVHSEADADQECAERADDKEKVHGRRSIHARGGWWQDFTEKGRGGVAWEGTEARRHEG